MAFRRQVECGALPFKHGETDKSGHYRGFGRAGVPDFTAIRQN